MCKRKHPKGASTSKTVSAAVDSGHGSNAQTEESLRGRLSDWGGDKVDAGTGSMPRKKPANTTDGTLSSLDKDTAGSPARAPKPNTPGNKGGQTVARTLTKVLSKVLICQAVLRRRRRNNQAEPTILMTTLHLAGTLIAWWWNA